MGGLVNSSSVCFLCPCHPARVATVCPHRGRGGLSPEGQSRIGEIALNCSTSWVLDRYNGGGSALRARPNGVRPPARRWWGGPKPPAGGARRGVEGGSWLPLPPLQPRGPIPAPTSPGRRFTAEAARFLRVPHHRRRFPRRGVLRRTCSTDPTLVREFFNPLPRA